MDPEKRRELAMLGGKAVPKESRSFSQNVELAKAAGRKGGASILGEKRAFSQNRELAKSAGAKGGATTVARARTRVTEKTSV